MKYLDIYLVGGTMTLTIEEDREQLSREHIVEAMRTKPEENMTRLITFADGSGIPIAEFKCSHLIGWRMGEAAKPYNERLIQIQEDLLRIAKRAEGEGEEWRGDD